MRVPRCLLACALLAGCSVDKPAERLVDHIERLLANDQCLRGIQSMRRLYYFDPEQPDLIHVRIHEAGRLSPGRQIAGPEAANEIWDLPFTFTANATYVVSTDQLDVWACGGSSESGVRHDPLFGA